MLAVQTVKGMGDRRQQGGGQQRQTRGSDRQADTGQVGRHQSGGRVITPGQEELCGIIQSV